MEHQRKPLTPEERERGREQDEAIFEIIYTLIGKNTPEADAMLEQMRQTGLKWYVEQAEAGIQGYIAALKLCAEYDERQAQK